MAGDSLAPAELVETPSAADETTVSAPPVEVADVYTLRRGASFFEDLARLESEDPDFKRELHKFTSPKTRKQVEAARKQAEESERAYRQLQTEHESVSRNYQKLKLHSFDVALASMSPEEKARRASDPQWAALVNEMTRTRAALNEPQPQGSSRAESDADRELYQDIDTAIEEAEASGISEGRAEWLRRVTREDANVKKLSPHKRMLWVAQQIAQGIEEDRPRPRNTPAPVAAAPPAPVQVSNPKLAPLAQVDTQRRSGTSRTGDMTESQWRMLKPFEWDPKLKSWGVGSVQEAYQKGFIKAS